MIEVTYGSIPYGNFFRRGTMKLVEGGWPTNARVGSTLTGRHYSDARNFDRELDLIWADTWLCAGRVEDLPLPGSYFTREVGKESVLCVRDQMNEVHAYFNVCRHRGSRICAQEQGQLAGGLVFCPYHSWGYRMDSGELAKTPNIPDDMEGFNKRDFPLKSLKADVWMGFIWINFNPQADTLAQSLGLPETFDPYANYHLEELKVGARREYDVRANWKLIMENALECYHCSTIHPELSRCTPPTLPRHWLHDVVAESDVVKHAGAMTLANGFERVGLTGDVHRPTLKGLKEDDRRRVFYFFVYPHAFFALAPDYVFLFTLWPTHVDDTVVRAYWLFEEQVLADPHHDLSDAVEFWDTTNQQDWIASELVQKGNESRVYQDGGVLIPNDWRVAQFSQYIQQRMSSKNGPSGFGAE